MDPFSLAILGLGLGQSFGLFGKKKKTKGVQKQYIENWGQMQQLLGPYIQAAAQAKGRGQALAGQQAADQMRSAYARTGSFGSNVLDFGRAASQGAANVAYGVTVPQEILAGMQGISQQAAALAGAAGPAEGSMPQGAQSMQDILGVLGTYLLSGRGGAGNAKVGGAGASTGVRYNPSRTYFGPGITAPPPNLTRGR